MRGSGADIFCPRHFVCAPAKTSLSHMASLRESPMRRSKGATLALAMVLAALLSPAAFLFLKGSPAAPRERVQVWQSFSSTEHAATSAPVELPWASCACALAAALLVAAAPALPARASILGEYLGKNEGRLSKSQRAAKLKALQQQQTVQTLEVAEKQAEETKEKVEIKETQLDKAVSNLKTLERQKEEQKAAGTLSPEEQAREVKLEKIRSVVTADLEKRRLEAKKKAEEAEEIAKKIEALARQARAAADLAAAQVDIA